MSGDVGQLLATARRYHESGQLEPAERLYRQILGLEPQHAEALHLLGLIAFQCGHREVALAYMRQSLALDERQASLHNNLGEVYRSGGQWEQARASYERAVELHPGFAAAHYNLGLLFQALGQPQPAAHNYQAAIRHNPQHAEAYNNLGNLLREQGQPQQAIDMFRAALASRPDYAEAIGNLASVLDEQQRYAEAEQLLRGALKLQPDAVELVYNLGNVYKAMKRLDDAAACYQQAIRLRPEYIEPRCNLGTLCTVRGRDAEALAHFDRCLEIDPNNARAHYCRGRLLLGQGKLAEGWREYEWRRKLLASAPHRVQPLWDGAELHGRRILIYAEWGLGDTLHFVRYLPLVRTRGGHVVFEVQKALIPLLSQSGFDDLIPMGQTPSRPCDWQSPILCLPRIFGTTLDNVPATIPYLSANSETIKIWRQRLQAYRGFRVGICWQGSPEASFDWRNVPLAAFAELANIPGVQLISLQRGSGVEQLAELAGRFQVVDLGDKLDAGGAFLDTAAVIKNLDLVITIDTAVAHLAGALGAAVWVALIQAPEWRWLSQREDCPWYPTMRLFRQTRLDDWSDVFARMAAELRRLVDNRPGGSVSGSMTAGPVA